RHHRAMSCRPPSRCCVATTTAWSYVSGTTGKLERLSYFSFSSPAASGLQRDVADTRRSRVGEIVASRYAIAGDDARTLDRSTTSLNLMRLTSPISFARIALVVGSLALAACDNGTTEPSTPSQ